MSAIKQGDGVPAAPMKEGVSAKGEPGKGHDVLADGSNDPVIWAERALVSAENRFSPDFSDVVAAICELADVYAAHGQHALAATMYRCALSVREEDSRSGPCGGRRGSGKAGGGLQKDRLIGKGG